MPTTSRLAGKAKITAEHVQSAVDFAQGVVDRLSDCKKRLEQVTAVVTSTGVIPSGNGEALLDAALPLRAALS